MEDQLKQFKEELANIDAKLADSSLFATAEGQKLAKRRAELTETIEQLNRLAKLKKQHAETVKLIEAGGEIAELAKTELIDLEQQIGNLTTALSEKLNPADPADAKAAVLEIRAGAGGNEAALFAGDLYRMYVRFAERQGWQPELLSQSQAEVGGFKEVIFQIDGAGAYGKLKYESGVHRVQRIPATESSGRIHTSTATVAVLPEAEEHDVEINPADIKIDTFRSSGPGGQSVNTTDSAVRITHTPTGIVVTCQDEKSQLKNKQKAMSVLRSRLLAAQMEAEAKKQSATRRSQIGTGERSEKIRTYNFPQDRITDHRIKLSLHGLNQILDGDIGELISKLSAAAKTES